MRIADANLEIESDDGSCLPEEICFDVCTLGDQELVRQLTKDYFKLDPEKVDKIFAEGQKNGNLCVILIETLSEVGEISTKQVKIVS